MISSLAVYSSLFVISGSNNIIIIVIIKRTELINSITHIGLHVQLYMQNARIIDYTEVTKASSALRSVIRGMFFDD